MKVQNIKKLSRIQFPPTTPYFMNPYAEKIDHADPDPQLCKTLRKLVMKSGNGTQLNALYSK